MAGKRPFPFGLSSAGTASARAEIGADIFPCIGNTYGIRIYAAAPSVPAILILGYRTVDIPLGPPFAANSHFYVDPATILLNYPFTTDANGCAVLHIGCRTTRRSSARLSTRSGCSSGVATP